MQGVAGLRAQVPAGPLLIEGCGVARGFLSSPGFASGKRVPLTRSPGSLDTASTGSTLITPIVTVTPKARQRAEGFAFAWQQLSGPLGSASDPSAPAVAFTHAIGPVGSYPAVWRCTVQNPFGRVGAIDVAYKLTRDEVPPPNLVTMLSPSVMTLDASIVTGSLTVAGGISLTVLPEDHPPITFLWVGADDFSPGPTAFLPDMIFNAPGTPQTIHYFVTVTATDSIGRADTSDILLIIVNWS